MIEVIRPDGVKRKLVEFLWEERVPRGMISRVAGMPGCSYAVCMVLPDPQSPFGARVRERLRDENVIWFTTVGADGTPQPNPAAWPMCPSSSAISGPAKRASR